MTEAPGVIPGTERQVYDDGVRMLNTIEPLGAKANDRNGDSIHIPPPPCPPAFNKGLRIIIITSQMIILNSLIFPHAFLDLRSTHCYPSQRRIV